MKKFEVYVYVERWEQKPFSRAFEAYCPAEAIEKCVKGLANDEHLCPSQDGDAWWRMIENDEN